MKAAVVYSSTHGSTRAVVHRLGEFLGFPFDVFNVVDLERAAALDAYDLLIFFSPTYGDEELQADMEQFLLRFELDLSGKRYAICELGNYYGYDSDFGAMKIIRHHLEALHGTQLIEPLSMDSLPRKDWTALEIWCRGLTARVGAP